ncbi:MAG: hypothetical protein JKY80_05510 [Mariprofundaceae bacterium]|nr:hypothetical protein [Mariprofundaceae bacterium]
MIYGQLCGRKTLREISFSWESHRQKHYLIGVSEAKRSTLSDANRDHPSGIYLELFYCLLNQLRTPTIQVKDAIRLIDSTTIDLCKAHFNWATFRSAKAGVKIHTVNGATYVFDRDYNDYAWYYSIKTHLKFTCLLPYVIYPKIRHCMWMQGVGIWFEWRCGKSCGHLIGDE